MILEIDILTNVVCVSVILITCVIIYLAVNLKGKSYNDMPIEHDEHKIYDDEYSDN